MTKLKDSIDRLEGPNPHVDFDFISQAFDVLRDMAVELDDDPILHDGGRLRYKIAQARNHLTECTDLLLRVSKEIHRIKKRLNQHDALLQIQINYLLTNDPEVMKQPNQTCKMAAARLKVIEMHTDVSLLEQALQEWEVLEKSAKGKRSDLRDLQRRLKDQMRLCQDEISSGGRWLKRPPGTKLPRLESSKPGKVDSMERILTAGERDPDVRVEADEDEDTTDLADQFLEDFDPPETGSEDHDEPNIDQILAG